MQSTYFGWPGRFLFIGRGGRSALHGHSMLQLVISLDRPVRVRQHAGDPYQSYQACVIAPHTPHQLAMTNRSTSGYMLWLDTEEFAYEPSATAISPIAIPDTLRAELENPVHTCAAADGLATHLTRLVRPLEPLASRDVRIETVCRRIRGAVTSGNAIVLEEMAEAVYLSPSRLMHLFKVEMGFTVRRYVLWQRKLRAMQLPSEGASLTDAAHAAGFSDSAHLTRTYRQMSGVAPSEIWQNSSFVQVMACSSD